ncbi:MAG: hypothetical protein NTV55_04590 [Planctomycetota bacterium]|nr:hypothetical protein [Planctomycetota bacterium]
MRAVSDRLLKPLWLCGLFVGVFLRVNGGVCGQEAAAPPPKPIQPPAGKPVADKAALEALVEDLGSPQFSRREAATDQLRFSGPAGLAVLRSAGNHPDPEVRRRALELTSPLEASLRLAPCRVSLERKSRTFRATLEALSKASGYGIEAWNNLEQPIDFGCDNLPMLEVIDQLGRITGTCIQQGYGDDRIRLGNGICPPLVAYDGAFRIVANTLQQYRTIDLTGADSTGPKRTETLTLGMAIFSEPRLPLLGVSEPRLLEAWSDDGQSLVPPFNEAPQMGGQVRRHVSRYGNGYRSQTQTANLVLHRPAGSSTRIRTLSAVVSCLVLVEQKQVPITTDLAQSKGKMVEIGSTSFTIEEVTGLDGKPGQQIQVKLAVREKNNDNPGDYTWMNSLYQRLELTDAAGMKFQNQGSSWGTSGPNFATITFTFGPPIPRQPVAAARARLGGLILPALLPGNNPPAPQPAKAVGPASRLVYTTWETMDHQIPFTFKDLPLP